jgi:hypothetical protein
MLRAQLSKAGADVMRCILALAILLGVCAQSALAQALDAEIEARRAFHARNLSGALVLQDVRTGRLVANVSVGDGADGLPLSAVKLLLVAIYFEHRRGLPSSTAPDVDAIIARGLDNPGRRLTIELRHALGDGAMLRDLARFGYPTCTARVADCTSLSFAESDGRWADALSIGETDFRATPIGLSRFLLAVGNRGMDQTGARVMSAYTAQHMQAAMLGTVRFGTAKSVQARLSGGVQMEGKTGTGPATSHPPDGLFAGLLLDHNGIARYTIVTCVRRGGFGGGAAAAISADVGTIALREKN